MNDYFVSSNPNPETIFRSVDLHSHFPVSPPVQDYELLRSGVEPCKMSSFDPKNRPKQVAWMPAPESAPVPPSSWAKRTGFRPKFSGETNASDSGQINLTPTRPREPENKQPDLQAGRARNTPSTQPALPPPPPPRAQPVANGESENVPPPDQRVKKRRDSDKGIGGVNGSGNVSVPAAQPEQNQQPRRPARNDDVVVVDGMDDDGFVGRHAHMKYELRDIPGLGENLTSEFALLCGFL